MLRWLNGGTSATTADSKDDTGSHKDDAPLFPMPGSIQRVANGLKSGRDAMQAEGQDDEPDEDDEDEHRDAMASLDLHISPPWPERTGEVSARQSATSVSKSSNSDPLDEFKAPSFSLSISSPSTNVTTDRLKSKPKPSHRAFPPEPISEASTLNNGRVTVSNGNVKANQQSLGSSLGLPPSTTVKPRKQRFVALEPGYSPLDWARLNREGDDDELRCGFDKPQRFTMAEVSEHATQTDAWSVFNGRVYNITPYLFYHPGGVKELMRVAGKDGTELFMQTHAWVNAELMMEGCLIGFLVRE